MATSTTLNIGEPADERSVDGNTVPRKEFSPHGGDQELSYEDFKNTDSETFEDTFFQGKLHMDIVVDYDEDDDETDDRHDEDNAKHKGFLQMFPDFLITTSDVCYKITPAVGAVTYGYFSLSILDPQWFSRAFGDIARVVGNTLWFQSHLGAGLYIYSHKHIKNLPLSRGIFYSLFGSVLFNFGSCMLWGLGKSYLPSMPTIRIAFGLISSCLLLYAGQDYLQYVDEKCSELD